MVFSVGVDWLKSDELGLWFPCWNIPCANWSRYWLRIRFECNAIYSSEFEFTAWLTKLAKPKSKSNVTRPRVDILNLEFTRTNCYDQCTTHRNRNTILMCWCYMSLARGVFSPNWPKRLVRFGCHSLSCRREMVLVFRLHLEACFWKQLYWLRWDWHVWVIRAELACTFECWSWVHGINIL